MSLGLSKSLRRRIAFGALVAAAASVGPSPASAAVTIGQVAPDGTPSQCNFVTDRLQPTVTSGNPYVVPSIGGALAITSWSYNATGTDPGQMMTMKVFRKVADPATYQAVGHDGPRPIAPGLNTFAADVPVQPGDVLGAGLPVSVNTACVFSAPGDSHLFLFNGNQGGNLADGASGAFDLYPDYRVNVSAVVAPSNSFTVGAVTRNKRRGAATINCTVPNPGDLSGAGKGVRAAGAAAPSKAVSAGQAKLLIRAKGNRKRKLNSAGKVKLGVVVTYTPIGGDPSSKSVRVKLKKKL